jgi:hypothetical protein
MKSKYANYAFFIGFFLIIIILPTIKIHVKSRLEEAIENQSEWSPEVYETANLYIKSKIFDARALKLPEFSPKEMIPTLVIARYRSEKSSNPKTVVVEQPTPHKALEDLSQRLLKEHRQDSIVGLKVYYPYGGLFPSETLGDDLESHPDRGLFAVIGRLDDFLTPSEILFGSHVASKTSQRETKEKQNILSNSHWSYFYVKSFYLTAQEIVPLFREHRTYFEINQDFLLTAAQRSGDALLDDLDENGKFVYSRYTSSVPENVYNILRHAGTLWTLADLHHNLAEIAKTSETKYSLAWSRGIQYLLQHIKACPTKPETSCVIETNEIKIGGAALSILALIAMEEPEKEKLKTQASSVTEISSQPPIYRQTAESLGEWLLSELNDDGKFKAHKYLANNYEPTDFVSEYYPGEAAFALMKLYHIGGDTKWLEAARKIIKAQIITQRSLPKEDVPHDHWLLYAIAESQKISSNSEESEHIFFISELIRQGQNKDPNGPKDWIGGYDTYPRSTPTAVRSEGLSAIHPMVLRSTKREAIQGNWTAIKNGVKFQLQTQIGPEITMELTDLNQSLGAFRKDLFSLETRIDYSQHNISSLLALRRLILESNAH